MLHSKIRSYKLVLFSLVIIVIAAVLNSCNKNMYQGINEPDIIQSSKLFIDSDPKSLMIYLDNNYLGGNTPDTINWLPNGSHKVTLKHELYPDTSFNIDLTNGELESIYINGFANPHFYNKIFVESNPAKAKIIFNDSITANVTPYTFTGLLPDSYKIKLIFPEHRSDSITVDVKKGITKYIKLILEDTTQFVTYNTGNSEIPSDHLTSVTVDNNNIKWIGSTTQGIFTFNGAHWKRIDTGIFKFNQISKMLFDKLNRLWVLCAGGLFMYDGSAWYDYNDKVGRYIINDISIDAEKNLIVSSVHGFYYNTGSNWTLYNSANTCMATDTVNTVYSAKNGNLWIGTSNFSIVLSGNNCSELRNGDFVAFPPDVSHNVKYIFGDALGNVWFYHKTLDKDHRNAFMILSGVRWYEKRDINLFPNNVNSIFADDNDYFWICRSSGVSRRSPDGAMLNINTTYSNLPVKECMQMTKDLAGNYWIVTLSDGLIQIKNGVLK